MAKSEQVEKIAAAIKESLNEITLPKMYHPTDDIISIPVISDGKKIVIEIKSV